MQEKLLGSLAFISKQVCLAAGVADLSKDIIEHLQQAGGGAVRLSPHLFLIHSEFLQRASHDEVDEALHIVKEILENSWVADGKMMISDFSPGTLGAKGFSRYEACLHVDPTTPMGVSSPDAPACIHMRKTIRLALDVLRDCDPQLCAEVNAITKQIILGKSAQSNEYELSGASSFEAWGAILLTASEDRDVIDLIQAIVHESAHLTLFAQAVNCPLVTNGPDETFASPLRHDKRPMDGIFHATFVSARMYQAMSKVGERGNLAPEDIQASAVAADTNRSNFIDGYKVIYEAAELTDLGRTLISEAAEYLNVTTS